MKRALAIAAVVSVIVSMPQREANARPEYALKNKLNCTSCHATPWGGGPRNIVGKAYGSHSNRPAKTSDNDYYYGDARVIAYHPKHASHTNNGLALMEAAATANVPIYEGDNDSEIRGVGTFNMSSLGGSYPREIYLRGRLSADPGEVPSFITFGRFYLPFGLLTDEHRAYTRIQTNMSLENYEIGGAFSANPADDFHFDGALVNDFVTGGGFSSNDVTWGGVANVRWNPSKLPFFLGTSANYQHTLKQPEPYAFSFYGGLSLDRISDKKIGGSILVERVDAQNWNNPAVNAGTVHPGLATFFIPVNQSAYLTAIKTAHSVGYYLQAKYDLNPRFTLLYRFDYLNPDPSLPDGSFARHGLGVEMYFQGNVLINARVEKSLIANPAISGSGVLADQDDLLVMFRWWI
jgi:hypothetical protein